tara:strand:- start:172 stop:969 length:798 start_codon:yes stop_codon:yes gene_type:complete
MNIKEQQELTLDREDIKEAFEEFLTAIEQAEEMYGEEAVLAALESELPDFNMEELESFPEEDMLSEAAPLIVAGAARALPWLWGGLKAGGGAVAKGAGKVKNYFKNLFTKSGRAQRAATKDKFAKGQGKGGAGGFLSGLAAGGADIAGDVMMRNLDQDVAIDDIKTDKALNVRSESLEDLIIRTNDAIEKMTQVMTDVQAVLGGKLEKIDTSIDDSIAAETGETTGQVKSRQGITGAGTAKPTKKKGGEEKKAEKPAPKPEPVAV